MLFQIRKGAVAQETIGGRTVHNTGESPFYAVKTDLFKKPLSEKEGTFKYFTGLDESDIEFNKAILDSDREILMEKAKKLTELVLKKYPEAKDSSNTYFWNPDRTRLVMSLQDSMIVHDTDTPDGALLYLNILGGGYPLISYSQEAAAEKNKEFYVIEVGDQEEKDLKNAYGERRKAIAALDELLESKGIDGLLWLSYVTSGMNKGRTRNTSKAQFEKDFMSYIEGEQTEKDKKKCAKNFLTQYKLFKTDKEALHLRAAIEAGIYHGLIIRPDGKKGKMSIKETGFELGTTIDQAVTKLSKLEYMDEANRFTDAVNEYFNA